MRRPSPLAAALAVVLTAGVAVAAVDATRSTHGGEALSSRSRPVPASSPTAIAATVQPQRPTSPARPTPRIAPSHPAAGPLYPLPAPPAYPHPCPPPKRPPGPPPPPPPKPKVKTVDLPAPVAVRPHRADLAVVRGKGIWLTTWPTSTVDVGTVVARARAAGLRQLWVRTGGTPQGYYGHHVLDALLPAAHAAGLDVVAWDFPTLSDPVADAARAVRTIRDSYGGQHVDAFSPDIETINEGTFNDPRRVRVYLSRVRAAAGDLPLIATVMRPTDYQLATYPYRAEASYVDVFAPMVYWSCNEPGTLALASIRPLERMRPVHLIGQSYDMADEGGRPGLPSGREIWRFLDVARRGGAIGASLYLYSQTRQPQWTALARYPW